MIMAAEKQGERVGLLGGTFNPVHMGHLRGAEEIRELFQLDRVIFIPAKLPPHKVRAGVMPILHRFNMVELAIRGNHHFTCSEMELKRKGKSYTVHTINHFLRHDEKAAHIFFILGVDAFREMKIWKDHEKVFSLCDWIVMDRPGNGRRGLREIIPVDLKQDFCYESKSRTLVHRSNHRIYFAGITLLDISSSKIRERIKRGESVRYLLPESVEEYIAMNQLYRD